MIKRRYLHYILLVLVWVIGIAACSTTADTLGGRTLSPTQAKVLIAQHQDDSDFVLLDVRTPAEFKKGHIQGAVLVDYYAKDVVTRLKTMDKEKMYLVYCHSGRRSANTLGILAQLGFSHTYHMDSGIVGWSREKYPLVQ